MMALIDWTIANLTKAQRRALLVMADCSCWVETATATSTILTDAGGELPLSFLTPVDTHYTINDHVINGRVARQLERLGLAKSRSQTPSGEVIRGRALAARLGEYQTVYTCTRAGLKAIGWSGEVLR